MVKKWWESETGEVNRSVFSYVAEVERVQFDLFDRFEKLSALYDPLDANSVGGNGMQSLVSENVIASNVDTVTAAVASSEIRARFMTDDGDWGTQRRARHLEWYADALVDLHDVRAKCVAAFKDGALKGTGLIKVFIDAFDRIKIERVLVDDIIVDNNEVRASTPRQIHQRMIVGRDQLAAAFPQYADEIESLSSPTKFHGMRRLWADYRPVDRDDIVVIESWRLPIGLKGRKGYVPGRRTITIEGLDLIDEPYHKDFFPFAKFTWSQRDRGWYGIGLAERIAGHQRALNKMNWQVDRQLDQHAVPTTYVRLADANLAVRTTNRAGTIVPIKGDYPQTVIPQAVSAETYRRLDSVKMSASHESGVSMMASHATKPAGLDSGAALREYRDATTQRFSLQERAFEQLFLDVVWLLLDACKDLGKDAPEVFQKSKHGPKKIKWSDVDMAEVKVQIAAANNLTKTPAGRTQLALEWAQAGVISVDEARGLMRHPDTERSMSLYTAALDDIERCIEEMLDGNVLVPEPYQNIKMGLWRVQQSYLKSCSDGAPEDIKELLRQWLVQAAWIQSQAEQAMAPPEAAGMTGAGVAPVQSL